MNEEKIRFMYDNNFTVNISMDGSKEEHDRNRVDINGNPTFERVYNNILLANRIISENHYQELTNNGKTPFLSILNTFDNLTNIHDVERFFLSNSELDKKISRISKVKSIHTNYYSKQKSNNDIKKRLIEMQDKYLNDILENNDISRYSELLVKSVVRPVEFNIAYKKENLHGTCIPGTKLTVSPNGDFHMCERIDGRYTIGSIDKGFDFYEISKHLKNFLSVINEYCGDCNVSNLCTRCFANCTDDQGSFEITEKACKANRATIQLALELYYTALENKMISEEKVNVF